MRYASAIVLAGLSIVAFAQEVQFDYERSSNFSAYATYQWVNYKEPPVSDQIPNQDIKRAVEKQLASKGLVRVEAGGDLLVGYQATVSREYALDNVGAWGGPGWWAGPGANTRITPLTIDVGKLVVYIVDSATRQLVWRGSASQKLDMQNDPGKHYRNLEKAVARLFRSYPRGSGKN